MCAEQPAANIKLEKLLFQSVTAAACCARRPVCPRPLGHYLQELMQSRAVEQEDHIAHAKKG